MSWKIARSMQSERRHFVPLGANETLCGCPTKGWVIESKEYDSVPPEMTCSRCRDFHRLGYTVAEARKAAGMAPPKPGGRPPGSKNVPKDQRVRKPRVRKPKDRRRSVRETATETWRETFGISQPCRYCAEQLPRTDDGMFHVWRSKYLVECTEPVMVPSEEQRRQWRDDRARLVAN